MVPHWARYVDLYARVKSGGAFQSWDYVRHISQQVSPRILDGNARILVSMPPRHGKSLLLADWLPTWFLDLFPSRAAACVSYEARKAEEWGRSVRDRFAGRVRSDVAAANDWRFSHANGGGGMFTAGIGGPLTGRGVDLLVVDDPHKNYDDATSEAKLETLRNWIKSTAFTRLEPGASVVCIHTRWNDNDCIAYLEGTFAAENWLHIRIPALAEADDPLGRPEGAALNPDRYSRERLEALRGQLGPLLFNAMFQQRVASIGGNIWRREWFRHYTELPPGLTLWLQSWDLSFKKTGKSYVTGQVWATDGVRFFLVDQFRERLDFVNTAHAILSMCSRYPQSAGLVFVEDKANGPAIMSALRSRVPGLSPVEPYGSKLARAVSVQGDMSSGLVYLPASAPWLDDYLDEVTRFPNAKTDDQVDTTSQALIEFRKLTVRGSFLFASL